MGKALNLEFSAVQQHSTQARLVAAWGLSEAAASLSKETEKSCSIDCMLVLGAALNRSHLRPLKFADDLSTLLRINQ